MLLTRDEIAQVTAGRWVNAQRLDAIESISTDSRSLDCGSLFVALVGESFDAHNFVNQARESGAVGAVVQPDKLPSSDSPDEDFAMLQVDDSLHALGDMAVAWRKKCPAQRVAIVGSSGKTTTKDMLAGILQRTGETLANVGNFNNLIGLPQTLFRLEPSHRWAVLELGMNQPGELSRLTQIAEPHLLLLLNVGYAHIGQFSSKTALLEAKSEAVSALREGVPIVYNRSCSNCREIVQRYAEGRPLLSFSVGEPAEVWADNVQIRADGGYEFQLHLGSGSAQVQLPVFGRYNVENAVAAAAAAHSLGVDLGTIVTALSGFSPAQMRSQLRQINAVTWVMDCYNASPDGMQAALESLAEWKAELKQQSESKVFLVLGEMLELGRESERFHQQLAEQVAGMSVDGICAMGDAMRPVIDFLQKHHDPDSVHWCESHADIVAQLREWLSVGDTVFMKGARLNALEKIPDLLSDNTSKSM